MPVYYKPQHNKMNTVHVPHSLLSIIMCAIQQEWPTTVSLGIIVNQAHYSLLRIEYSDKLPEIQLILSGGIETLPSFRKLVVASYCILSSCSMCTFKVGLNVHLSYKRGWPGQKHGSRKCFEK